MVEVQQNTQKLVRICAAGSTTQLLPLIHILRHQPQLNYQDILLWDSYIMGSAVEKGALLMQAVAESYPFAATFRLNNFLIPTSRNAGSIGWPFQFLARHRHDAQKLKGWLLPYLQDQPQIEIWTDEPIHFPMRFLHGMFPKATHVKIPHAFNLEDSTVDTYRENFLSQYRSLADFPHQCLWKLNYSLNGIQYNAETGLIFDRAYTFNSISSWSTNSVDLSQTITLKKLEETYQALPSPLKLEIQSKILTASGPTNQPWILLLLFGLNKERKNTYYRAIHRILREHPQLFLNRKLILKPHPVSDDSALVKELVDDLSRDLNTSLSLFDCKLNLDILWHLIPAEIILAGPCGALPIVKLLGNAKPLVIKEIMDEFLGYYPPNGSTSASLWKVVEGIDII